MDYNNIKLKKIDRFDIQRRVVSHMTSASWRNVPHVSYIYEPDITDFYYEFTKLVRAGNGSGCKISFNTIMLKAIVEGLVGAPDLNSYIEYSHRKVKGKLYILDEINISTPWLLPDGRMITPIIPNAEKMSVKDISRYVWNLSKRIERTNIDEMLYRAAAADTVNELKKFNLTVVGRVFTSRLGQYKVKGLQGKEKADYYNIPESERLTERDIMRGTVTVSNIGSLYKDQRGFFALLEIIPPQVFAVGLGAIQERPGVHLLPSGKREIAVRKVLPMCLAFDHRAVDFNSIVPFLKKLDDIFARPYVIHKW